MIIFGWEFGSAVCCVALLICSTSAWEQVEEMGWCHVYVYMCSFSLHSHVSFSCDFFVFVIVFFLRQKVEMPLLL